MRIRYLTATCAFTIVMLCMLTLAFSTNAKRAFYLMQSPSTVNVALSSNGAVASASSIHPSGNFPVAAVNNGDRKAMNWGSGGGWKDNTPGDYSSDIVQINFPAFNFVSQINVFTLRDNYQDNQTPPTLSETFSTCENSGYGITEFDVQYWNGSLWVTVPGGLVRDNNKVWRQLTFPEVWAGAVRVQVHGAARFTTAINYSRIIEIEAYGQTTGFNLAAAANGAVAVASSQFNANYPVSAVNDGDRTGFNWGRGGFGSGWNDATENEYSIDWVRIDFAGGQAHRINEIDVYTLRDGYNTNPDDPTIFETFPTADDGGGHGITDYDVQYLSGGVWRNVPGGKVMNNNKARRQFQFSPITTNAIRVSVHRGVHHSNPDLNCSRIVEIEAWENAATPDDVVWVEDALPAGATPAGYLEGWNWTCFNPLPLSGTLAHTSEIVSGFHQHLFLNATQTFTVNAGDTLVAHVYLDPANPPTSLMLQWNDGTWEHRAYWGENQYPWGVDGTTSRRNMGALPPTGQWVRLEVPASLVGLEGRTLNSMAFQLTNGRATWDHAGKYAAAALVQPTISISDATVNESNSGTTSAVFNVTLSSASTQTISVNYATANGTAATPSDYAAASGTVTFLPGQTSQPITIQAVGDTANESDENFFVNLSGAVNATLADGQGAGTIRNLSYFEIPVYFHVIQDTNGNGFVDESRLDAQINVLNNAFNGPTFGANVQFFFWKADVTRTTNDEWFQMDLSPDQQQELGAEYEAKRTLRQGSAKALNFYTARGGTPRGTPYRIGWARFPNEYASNPCRDGVVVPFTTLPGDTTPNNPYNEGDLPVHEVGHWLGLFHTFEGGCNQTNDQVDDTPAHISQFVGECPSPAPDTCNTLPGTDPIHNYMTDYSDACKSEFTRGQFERMRDQYTTYRQPSTTPPSCPIVTMSISDVTVTEGNGEGVFADFTVTLSASSTQPIVANFTTADGTASAGSDYIPLTSGGTVNFAVGEQTKTIRVQVIGDTTVEANENFFVNLFNPVNAALADRQGVGTILNDDAPPPPVYEGWVDIADCNSIIGWAADRNRLNTSITVSIYDGNTFVTSIPANGSRSDVGAYLQDNGLHGFGISTPARFKDGLPHTLRVKFESSTTELSSSPRTITCVTYYEIVARHSGKCLDVEGESTAAGARVIQFSCGGWANQQWKILPVGGGYYKIVARHSGKVLDVQWGGLDNGTPVWQWDDNGSFAQQWQIIDVGSGYVRIMARHSGKALDVEGGSTADLAQIHQWDYVGIANQQWLLRLVP
jgi:Ricin-type beta-trefoil lectin domain-like/Calx-beta domain/Pregnancy-associated plasma protein-A